MPRKLQNIVVLRAVDHGGKELLSDEHSLEDYYGGGVPLIDSDEFRARNGVARVYGKLYAPNGSLGQDFWIEYENNGAYRRSRIVHSDGTIIED